MTALFGTGECSGLIAPAGGRLVDLRVDRDARDRLAETADGLPSLTLDRRAEIDLTLLAHGGYSPLDRFLGRDERRTVVEDLRLTDGSFFPLPLTLEISKAESRRLDAATSVALRSESGELRAVLDVDEVYEVDDRAFVAGRPRVVETPVKPAWRRFHWTPRETRECLERFGTSRVVAFEGAGTIDEVWDKLLWDVVEDLDGVLLVQPPGTPTPELEALARSRRSRACVAVLPWVSRHGDDGVGPERELLARALVHRNYGASHVLAEGPRALRRLERHAGDTGVTPVAWSLPPKSWTTSPMESVA